MLNQACLFDGNIIFGNPRQIVFFTTLSKWPMWAYQHHALKVLYCEWRCICQINTHLTMWRVVHAWYSQYCFRALLGLTRSPLQVCQLNIVFSSQFLDTILWANQDCVCLFCVLSPLFRCFVTSKTNAQPGGILILSYLYSKQPIFGLTQEWLRERESYLSLG